MLNYFFSKQRIIDYLKINYRIDVIALMRLSGGADINAALYRAQASDESLYFIKLKYGLYNDIGVTIQQLLYSAGIEHIISPIITKDDQPIFQVDDFTIVVYPFIEGQDGFSHQLTNDQWIIFGQALKQVHEFQLSPLIKKKLKQETYCSKWRVAVRAIYAYIDTKPKLTDAIALKLLAYMHENRDIIQRLVYRAEQLGQKIKEQSPKFVLCHSDVHAGNVVLANDGLLYIVDWDQPIMAPKERDLMFIGAGVGNVWNKSNEEELFYKGYGKTKINNDILAYYRYERIVEDIAEYTQQLMLTTEDVKNREIMYNHFLAMFEPQGVVDIAFKTDTNL